MPKARLLGERVQRECFTKGADNVKNDAAASFLGCPSIRQLLGAEPRTSPNPRFCGAGGHSGFLTRQRARQGGGFLTEGQKSEHQKSAMPACVAGRWHSEAKPGEVRAVDLPLVRHQPKGALPSPAQWIRGFQPS